MLYRALAQYSEIPGWNHHELEKDANGKIIDYMAAVTGHLNIVPDGQAKEALAKDYAAMLADDVMVGDALSFDELLQTCADLESKLKVHG